jgi:hypothetical protein
VSSPSRLRFRLRPNHRSIVESSDSSGKLFNELACPAFKQCRSGRSWRRRRAVRATTSVNNAPASPSASTAAIITTSARAAGRPALHSSPSRNRCLRSGGCNSHNCQHGASNVPRYDPLRDKRNQQDHDGQQDAGKRDEQHLAGTLKRAAKALRRENAGQVVRAHDRQQLADDRVDDAAFHTNRLTMNVLASWPAPSAGYNASTNGPTTYKTAPYML